ncbi:histone deacetylase [Bowmanella sp. JS7-9]|uniref:Histone deacetylase n=1 Tax=Pseudobowmanella zhangzhouensis TaxID=1537679 RepID=A0ABW1XRU0_9ALTE
MPALIFHPIYSQLDLPERHRFPIEKYQGIADALNRLNPEIMYERPDEISEHLLTEFFQADYVQQFLTNQLPPQAMRRIGFPWSEQLVRRTRTAVGGTLLTAKRALEQGIALNLTGGYHHAFADFGSGFCIFNDLYLAARHMLTQPGVDRVLIVDCDVHQGDGTAALAANDNDVFTLSLHGEKNFPYRKQISDLDFALQSGCEDDEYLTTLEQALHLAFMQSGADAVIYDAGVDIHVDDDLGLLNITTQGVLCRDQLVINTCRKHGVPVASVIGGGYQRDIDALVKVHLQLFFAAGVKVL